MRSWQDEKTRLLQRIEELESRLAQAEALAERDPLTGALNRRGFMRALEQAIAFADRYREPAAVVFIDLDAFKTVNDAFGHAAGDAVLKHVARLLMSHVRESDIVGRLGGDEFGVILARAAPDEAVRKGEALTALIAQTPCIYAGVAHRVAASCGARSLARADDPELALAAADEAMYAEKRARRLRRTVAFF
ncbi:MAG: GGDEF domain-containing protein [Alphaproteobacteria bacterium]|jgi:diguanylate cyclase (GGDEF)-like protein|nr:GGDEF domain-containing protein [Alphaproteobacteria bacterium]